MNTVYPTSPASCLLVILPLPSCLFPKLSLLHLYIHYSYTYQTFTCNEPLQSQESSESVLQKCKIGLLKSHAKKWYLVRITCKYEDKQYFISLRLGYMYQSSHRQGNNCSNDYNLIKQYLHYTWKNVGSISVVSCLWIKLKVCGVSLELS